MKMKSIIKVFCIITLCLALYSCNHVGPEVDVTEVVTEEVKNVMRKNHIAVKAGTFDAPRLAKSLGIEENGAVRFSFGYFNTRMEVNDAIWVLMQIQGLTDLHYLA